MHSYMFTHTMFCPTVYPMLTHPLFLNTDLDPGVSAEVPAAAVEGHKGEASREV